MRGTFWLAFLLATCAVLHEFGEARNLVQRAVSVIRPKKATEKIKVFSLNVRDK